MIWRSAVSNSGLAILSNVFSGDGDVALELEDDEAFELRFFFIYFFFGRGKENSYNQSAFSLVKLLNSFIIRDEQNFIFCPKFAPINNGDKTLTLFRDTRNFREGKS